MNKISTVLLLTIAFIASGCAKIYYSPDAKVRASSHQIIAIAPPK